MMLFNKVRTELMGMYFKSTRIPLRSEVVFMMHFKRIRAELMRMYFKSTRFQLRCEVVFILLVNRTRTELMGTHFTSTRIHLRVRTEVMGVYCPPIRSSFACEGFIAMLCSRACVHLCFFVLQLFIPSLVYSIERM